MATMTSAPLRATWARNRSKTCNDIVKLTATKQKRYARRGHCSCLGDLRSQVYHRRAQFVMMVREDVVARDVEELRNRIMDGNEALQMPF